MMGEGKSRVLVIPECPGAEAATALVQAALDDIGLPRATFAVRLIATDEAARAHRFAALPSSTAPKRSTQVMTTAQWPAGCTRRSMARGTCPLNGTVAKPSDSEMKPADHPPTGEDVAAQRRVPTFPSARSPFEQ